MKKTRGKKWFRRTIRYEYRRQDAAAKTLRQKGEKRQQAFLKELS